MACQFLVSHYIHNDVIEHQSTLYDTYKIITTEILLLQWIHNRAICQGNDFFDGGKNSFPNSENVFFLFFGLE